MAQVQLSPVLRHIRKLVASSGAFELADAQLLERFKAQHEDAAFAALVQRHGRLVWSVCWHVLHHEQDVEDAFQATFLVLARQAGSIRKGATVASWLYRVAYRTALRARTDKSRRRAQERKAAKPVAGEPTSELAWQELQAVLVEEMNRLPEKYRAPFLLCCLEGKSKPEAAQELGWKEGTVSSRLAQAREHLQRRLARRGVLLSAVLGAFALAPQVASAVASRALIDSTIRAAGLFASADGGAGAASGAALALAQGVLKTMAATKLKSVIALLLAVGLITGGVGVLTHQTLAEMVAAAAPQTSVAGDGQGQPPKSEKMELSRINPASAKKDAHAQPESKDRVALGGQVLGEDGKPLAGAQVAVLAALKLSGDGTSFAMENGISPEAEVLAVGKTDSDGRYRVRVPRKRLERAQAVEVLARSAAHGVGQQAVQITPKPADTVIRLAREEVLHGRLIDLEGLPAAGVKVSVVRLGKLSYPANRQYTMHADSISPEPIFYQDFQMRADKMPQKAAQAKTEAILFADPPRGLPPWPEPAVTDANGRFTLRALSPGQALGLQIRDQRYAAQNLDVTLPEKGGTVTLAISPLRLLEGAVTDATSGKPIPLARIHLDCFPDYFGGIGVVGDPADEHGRRLAGSYYVSIGPLISRMDCQADNQGRFRINPFQASSVVVTISAPAGQPYLVARKNVGWPEGAVRQELNVALPRGVLVRGKVEEAFTGKPVAGSRLDFWCKSVTPSSAFADASQFRIMYDRWTHAGSDGAFQTILPPGKWYVLANVPGEKYLWQKLPVEDAATIDPKNPKGIPGKKKGNKHYFRPDGWVAVDAKLGQAVSEVKIALHDALLQGRLLAPDGKPVARAVMFYRRRSLDWRLPALEVSDGKFKLPVPDLDTTYRVLFLDSENGLGGIANLSGKQAGGQPVTVSLAPCGSARVRFVDSKGKPLAKYRPLVWALVPPSPVFTISDYQIMTAKHLRMNGGIWLGHADPKHYAEGPLTDADGYVTLPNLIAGATYQISQFENMAVNFTVEAAKTKNLRDVVIKEPDKPVSIPTK